MQRYLIENRGANKENINFMFSEALRICQCEGISKITLFVSSKKVFPSTVVGQMLGDVAKRLCQGQTVGFQGNISLDLESASKAPRQRVYEMVVYLYLSSEACLMLDSVLSAKVIIFLPWMEDEGKMWLSTWNATILGTHTWPVQQTSLPQTVNNALSALSQGVNLSTGLAHPSDRDEARRVLIELRKFGHVLSPNDVKVWALQNGWRSDHAKDLAEEVARIFKSN